MVKYNYTIIKHIDECLSFYDNYFLYTYTQSTGHPLAPLPPQFFSSQSERKSCMCLRGCRSLHPHTVTLTVQHQSHKMHDGGRELYSELILNIQPHALNTV